MHAAQEGNGSSLEVDVKKFEARVGRMEDRVWSTTVSVVKLEVGVEWFFKKIAEMQEDIRELRRLVYENRR
jgi:hypothetical protein